MTPHTKKLRIAVWHNLPAGGGKRALYYHVKGLIERGHTVEAWCPPSADQTHLPLSPLIQEHIVPLDWHAQRSRHPLARAREVVDMIRAMERHCQQCAAQINRGEYDLLFANSCRLLRVTSIAREVTIPTVLYLHEPYRTLYEASPRLPWAALPWPGSPLAMIKDFVKVQGLRIQVREEVRNAQAFDAIFTNSFFSRESILRAYGCNARVCYLGIDSAVFVNQHAARENFVIGLGAFAPEKNIEQVIAAIAALPAARPRLVWVGNVANKRYFAAVQARALQSDVLLEPMTGIGDSKLVDLLNRAALMVYAPHLEPFGLAPLEANACGAPVVAVAEGGVRETIIDGVNGLLVEHPRALPAAIARLLGDPVYARQLGENGSALVKERWSLSAAIDRLEERLFQAAGGKGA